ncbi:hypothetical protein HID58_059548 [Brassica napus]|uniref:Ubiquinone biosynthesis O-methyltransferase, mitochondrial n=1 Tax=Brassica napus TaxID=3708 RepID=A0ABQ7ZT86_BRANA|nr:hypothetical protein HID58_059548 [Brassica napus]
MNQMQRILLSARRLSPSIIPPCCFLHRRPFSTSETDASSAVLSSSHQKIQTFEEDRASDKSRSSTNTSFLKEHELAKFSAKVFFLSKNPFRTTREQINLYPHLPNFAGPFKPLHFSKDPSSARPFEGLRLIDVGCGGGLLSEPLARMGATVTGIDAVEKNVKIARLHAVRSFWFVSPVLCLLAKVIVSCAEKLVDQGRTFDAVLALEVIEHVANPAEFSKSLSALTIPNGATILSTINRSLPKGTHQWSSFLTPEELTMILQRTSLDVKEMAGFVYNPITGRWLLSDDIGVNFI